MIWLAVDAQELPRCVEPVDLWIMFSLAGVEMHSTVARMSQCASTILRIHRLPQSSDANSSGTVSVKYTCQWEMCVVTVCNAFLTY